MAKRSFSANAWTPTATADTTAMANGVYMAVGASGTTTAINVLEIYIGGEATASTVNNMVFARESTLGATPTALAAPNSDGPLDTRTATATLGLSFVAATTGPSRSAVTTSARLIVAHNAFGGIVRWVAAPGEEWGITGTTVSVSESCLSCITSGGGVVSSHIIYEPF